MSAIPRPVARRLDRLSRAAHRFHRFAHHPLCDEYAGEVVRVGRRARVCRGCLLVALGGSMGVVISFFLPAPAAVGAALAVISSAWVAVTTLLRIGPRRSKLATRFAPACALGFALGDGLALSGTFGHAVVALTLVAGGTLAVLYRRRGGDRTPCARCPERVGAAPCRGFAEIVHRERAFRRLATRVLARAGM